jgi:hypothetical protein
MTATYLRCYKARPCSILFKPVFLIFAQEKPSLLDNTKYVVLEPTTHLPEKVAIKAVMAGCKPESMPVIVAALKAIGELFTVMTVLPRARGTSRVYAGQRSHCPNGGD